MPLALGTMGPSVYWYTTRSSGVVSLVLLTASVVLGVIDVQRWSSPGWPRFVLDSLHRTVSLLAVVFLGLHILTAALDSFAPISPVDAVVPFIGSYRPLWLGLGAVAFDLLLAVAVTSWLRRRLGHRAWRMTHWLAYASWPIALLHGLGTGSDVKSSWSLALTAVCVVAVAAAVSVRALAGWPERRIIRGAALTLTAIVPIGLVLWLPGGPLGHGWARRAGTPVSLLASKAPNAASPRAGSASPRTGGSSSTQSVLRAPFSVNLSGGIRQIAGPAQGLVAVKIATSFSGPPAGRLDIEIDGQPTGEGGVSLSSSRVTLGGATAPTIYRGQILTLNGTRLIAKVTDGKGQSLFLRVNLGIDAEAGTVRGTLAASAA
jgi:DMSO/TMAO reductase YedYZ heme-binding membrane subunit